MLLLDLRCEDAFRRERFVTAGDAAVLAHRTKFVGLPIAGALRTNVVTFVVASEVGAVGTAQQTQTALRQSVFSFLERVEVDFFEGTSFVNDPFLGRSEAFAVFVNHILISLILLNLYSHQSETALNL